MAAARKKAIKDRIDVIIPATPPWRFQKRSGATTTAEHTARKGLLKRLIEAGQLTTIKDLADDRITWEELRQAERDKRIGRDDLGADISLARLLWDGEGDDDQGAFAVTLPKMGKPGPAGIQTRKRYALVFDQLRTYGVAAGLSPKSQVRDLATTKWAALWAAMGDLSPASRNHVRRGVSAFLTQFLDNKHHPYRHKVCKALGANEDATAAARDIEPHEEWPVLMAALNEAVQPTAFVLAFTGMRIAEYLQLDDTSVRHGFITIPGYKDPAAIPEGYEDLVRQAIPCRLAPAPARPAGVYPGVQYDARYKKIYKAFKAAEVATGIKCTPHYLRHLYAAVGVDEAPTVHVQHALRHKTPAMTADYAKRRSAKQVSNAVAAVLGPAVGLMPAAPKRRPKKAG